MFRFQEKNHCQGRVRIEKNIFARFNMTPQATKFVLEDWKDPQIEQPDHVSGKIELSTMEAMAMFRVWPNIMLTNIICDRTENPTVVKTFRLLPKGVKLYNNNTPDICSTIVQRCVTVEVVSGPEGSSLRFSRVQNYADGGPIERRLVGKVEINSNDGIGRLDKFVISVENMRLALYSTPKPVFEMTKKITL